MNYQNISDHDSPRLDPGLDPRLQAYQADFADHVSTPATPLSAATSLETFSSPKALSMITP